MTPRPLMTSINDPTTLFAMMSTIERSFYKIFKNLKHIGNSLDREVSKLENIFCLNNQNNDKTHK